MRSDTISTVIGLHLLRFQQGIKLAATLCYSREDPYAVHIAFSTGKGEPVKWMVGRDLLADGMWHRAGLGYVALWPSDGAVAGAPGRNRRKDLSVPYRQAH